MKNARFEWDEHNLEYISRHDIDPDEAYAVLDNSPVILRTGDGKYLAYGLTDDGRFLLIVFVRKLGPVVRVITGRDMTEAEKKQYRRRRR
jgi:uncharacterized DUF497 family protein